MFRCTIHLPHLTGLLARLEYAPPYAPFYPVESALHVNSTRKKILTFLLHVYEPLPWLRQFTIQPAKCLHFQQLHRPLRFRDRLIHGLHKYTHYSGLCQRFKRGSHILHTPRHANLQRKIKNLPTCSGKHLTTSSATFSNIRTHTLNILSPTPCPPPNNLASISSKEMY